MQSQHSAEKENAMIVAHDWQTVKPSTTCRHQTESKLETVESFQPNH